MFDGTKDSAYTEDDPPNPINAYGRSKLAGERAMIQSAGDYLILRTSWVFAARGHNFLQTMLRLARERDELSHRGRPDRRADLGARTSPTPQRSSCNVPAGSGARANLHREFST